MDDDEASTGRPDGDPMLERLVTQLSAQHETVELIVFTAAGRFTGVVMDRRDFNRYCTARLGDAGASGVGTVFDEVDATDGDHLHLHEAKLFVPPAAHVDIGVLRIRLADIIAWTVAY
ncbi:MAG: hypothetical protein JWR11_5878 [Mycobacterium sp.]|nr:hypothetical protein [Mycobacterium sp.]MDT5177479.1 hypothetical protein [Mycobacterium sp.]